MKKLVLILFSSFLALAAIPALAAIETPTPLPTTPFDVGVKIPGLQFGTPYAEGKSIVVPYLAQYISAAYRYMIGIAIIAAIIMIMWGGFQYMVGSTMGDAKHGKKTIENAVGGLIILFAAVLILKTVNPATLNLTAMRIENASNFAETENTEQDLEPDDLTTPPPPASGKVPLYKQWKYKDVYGGCGTIAKSGCGPTAAAMVMSSYGQSVDPPTVAKLFADGGYRLCKVGPPRCDCQGTAHAAFRSEKILQQYNLKGEKIDQERMLELLQKDIPIIVSVRPSIFTKEGHFIVLTSIDKDGNISVNDPNKTCYKINGKKDCSGKVPKELVLPFINNSSISYIHS